MELFKEDFSHPFIEGSYQFGGSVPKTIDELDIIKLSADIREKLDWNNKIKDSKIVMKWREEISGQISQSEPKFEYVMDELLYYISLKDDTCSSGSIEVAAVDGTWQSDFLIDESERQKLINCVKQLENIPEKLKDWHPGSNGQVLDLVHPSLYCFVSGRSRVLKQPFVSKEDNLFIHFASEEQCMSSEEASKLAFLHTEIYPSYCKSTKFQWLPSEFKVSENGSVKVNSYINNLHPEIHKDLYRCIEKIFEMFIPLFNNVLTDLRNPRGNRISVPDNGWYEDDTTGNFSENEDDEDEMPVQIPKSLEIPKFKSPPTPKVIVNLSGRTVQAIVKLASIELTPNKPEYPGGVWHVEGMANERIVASGIYYFSSVNITESRLLFRQAVLEPDYEQNDNVGVEAIYGLVDNQPLNQNLGSIVCKQGRCIAFPNTLQHRVSPFKLEDSTRPGHRKILVIFLVDPTVRILSTAQVPPQQNSWFFQEIIKEPLLTVPQEIAEKIVRMLDWPMTLKEAKNHRDELMTERKYFIKNNNEMLFERSFSLCEH